MSERREALYIRSVPAVVRRRYRVAAGRQGQTMGEYIIWLSERLPEPVDPYPEQGFDRKIVIGTMATDWGAFAGLNPYEEKAT